MRISKLHVENYRSIESLSLDLPHFYTAICGKNDAGKSNLIRVLRLLFKTPETPYWPDEDNLSLQDDYTNWKDEEDTSRFIFFRATLEIRPDDDEGLYRFLESYLHLSLTTNGVGAIELDVSIRYTNGGPKVAVRIAGQDLEELKAEETLKKIKTSFTVLFHDSTEFLHPYRFLESTGLFRDIPASEAKKNRFG